MGVRSASDQTLETSFISLVSILISVYSDDMNEFAYQWGGAAPPVVEIAASHHISGYHLGSSAVSTLLFFHPTTRHMPKSQDTRLVLISYLCA